MLNDFLPPDKEAAKKAVVLLKHFEQKLSTDISLISIFKILVFSILLVQLYFLSELLTGLVSLKYHEFSFFQLLYFLYFTGIIRFFLNSIADKRSNDLHEKVVRIFRSQLVYGLKYDSINTAQKGFTAGHSIGFLHQTEVIAPYFSRYVPQVNLCKVVPILSISCIFYINWISGLIILITVPAIPVFMIVIGKGTESKSRDQWLNLSHMGSFFLDRLTGITTIYLFDRLNQEIKLITEYAENYSKSVLEVLRIAFISGAVLDFFSAVSMAGIAIYTGLSLIGYIHLGPVSSFTLNKSLLILLLVPEFFSALRTLGSYYHDRSQAIGAVMHLQGNGVFDELIESDNSFSNFSEMVHQSQHNKNVTFTNHPPDIRFQNVLFYYEKSHIILNNFQLLIKPYDKIKINGKNGSGKTSVLSLLLGWESPISGAITFGGFPITNFTEDELLQTISWIGQRTTIFKGTIRSNILMGSTISDDELYDKILKPVSLVGFIDNLPLGLDTQLAEDGRSVSGGERQKIALARTLVKNHKILLLDEPLTNLDYESAIEFIKIMEQTTKDKTVIITGHGARYDQLREYKEINLNLQ